MGFQSSELRRNESQLARSYRFVDFLGSLFASIKSKCSIRDRLRDPGSFATWLCRLQPTAPRVPWGQSPVHRGICSLCLCRGSGSFLVGLPPFRPQAPSPSTSVSLQSGSEPCGPSPRTLPQAASGGFKQESDMMFEKE